MDSSQLTSIKKYLQKKSFIQLAIIYGSAIDSSQTPESDLDLAVADIQPLSSATKMTLIEDLSILTSRPIDLIDLQTINGVLLTQILTKGKTIIKKDPTLYGEIIKRMLFNNADFMPYHHRILKERREQWINN